ncbi:type II secretion system F family protein [Campylobacter gastrosuis]|uniref:Type II secretion system F family protein n=1 Tax=Campylobacter gastrosuis TaxID=2974576 RepID=A0ABT7HN84_9BACT|nr:type II secretion system F family protein [Campylobacter gastrosuis]MDL0088387.1 type II secretion system F family protein [Campylobacter gastrosuis]
MKFFDVEYIENGRRQKITLKANSKSDVKNIAAARNYGMIVKIGETTNIPLADRINEFGDTMMRMVIKPKLKTPTLVATIRQLSVMTNAGISIHDSVKEIAKSSDDKRLQEIFNTINEDLNQGASLTDSIMAFKDEFGDVTIAMIRLGENTGNMAESLAKLAEIMQEVWDNQQKFKKAIRYPITVIIAIVIAFAIMMLSVVPKFREIFEQLGANLPLPTQMLLGIESALSNYGIIILAIFVGTIFFVKKTYNKSLEFKKKFDKYMLKVYLIGNILFFSSLSRFNLVFAELVRAGIPIAEALDTAVLTVTNEELKKKLSSVKILVGRGVSLTESFKDTELYESMLLQMINAGEQSGSLDAMLEKVTDYYKMKFNDIIDNISTYIEPILLAVLAVMVTFLALGIFMPMWDMAQAVKN